MGKRKRKATSSSAPKLEAIITEDGILSSILSKLPLKEAVRTCVLSRRWKHIWTHRPNLKLDVGNVFGARSSDSYGKDSKEGAYTVSSDSEEDTDGDSEEDTDDDSEAEEAIDHLDINEANEEKYIDKFIASVNSVLQQHQGAKVEKFTVEFVLRKPHSHHLDEWLRFAVASKTRKLRLNLDPIWFDSSVPLEPYEFPCKLFAKHKGSSIEYLSLIACSLKVLQGFDGFNNLKVLTLDEVDVTDTDISRLLFNCFTLEFLEISECQQLVTLGTNRPLSRLKNLCVIDCNKLRIIEMDAINLMDVSIMGVWVDIILTKSPQLFKAIIDFSTDRKGVIDMDLALTKLSSNLPNIEILQLRISDVSKVSNLPKDFITFIHLRSFTLELDSKMSLPYLASLLSAAPFLTDFEFRCSVRVIEEPPRELRKLERLPKHPHLHLKNVKIGKFYGDKWQLEIVLHLLNNATELESLKIKKARHRKGFSVEIREKVIQYITRKAPTKCQISVN